MFVFSPKLPIFLQQIENKPQSWESQALTEYKIGAFEKLALEVNDKSLLFVEQHLDVETILRRDDKAEPVRQASIEAELTESQRWRRSKQRTLESF